MKTFLEKSKDTLHDYIDYIIMLGIVGIVVFIIGWRLDLLFPNDSEDLINKNNIAVEDELFSNNESFDIVSDTDNKEFFELNIPDGSSTYDVAIILESNKIISNKSDFIDKTEEAKLSNRLKAGNFEIPYDSSVENILEILIK